MTHGLDGLGITVSTEFGMGEDSLWFPVSDILSIHKSHIWIPALLKPHKCIPGAQFFIFKWGVFPIITAFYLPVLLLLLPALLGEWLCAVSGRVWLGCLGYSQVLAEVWFGRILLLSCWQSLLPPQPIAPLDDSCLKGSMLRTNGDISPKSNLSHYYETLKRI